MSLFLTSRKSWSDRNILIQTDFSDLAKSAKNPLLTTKPPSVLHQKWMKFKRKSWDIIRILLRNFSKSQISLKLCGCKVGFSVQLRSNLRNASIVLNLIVYFLI